MSLFITKTQTILLDNYCSNYFLAKTTWNSTEQDVLAARQQIATVDRKQIAVVQGNP